MMSEKESFRQRQEAELEVIQSIFGNDVADLRSQLAVVGSTNTITTGWKPLNLLISLVPQMGSSGCPEAYARIKLHIICPAKYPKVVPKISLENSRGLSDAQIDELTKELIKAANNLKGEVMIYDLTQIVQSFLHKHNKPPPGSFYDQMLLEKLKRSEDLMEMQQRKISQEQQIIREEVLKRKEMFRHETAKERRETRWSVSESSPTHRTSISSESSESSMPFRAHMMIPNECAEHQNSETLYFPNVGKKILKGCCLGHSHKGCVTYSGIDLETGQLLYVTEWNIKYSQFEAKCIPNCTKSDDKKCNGHSVDEILQNIDKQMTQLCQLRHKNLITYECLLTMKKKEYVVIYIVQDFVFGTSISSISRSLGWCPEGASIVAKGVLSALIFLHNKGISHSNLYDCTVFMDNSGIVRVTDFSLVPYLLELTGCQKTYQGDLPALGSLMHTLLPTIQSELRDFIDKCRSERTLSASDLADHPFLRSQLFNQPAAQHQLIKPTPATERSTTQFPIHVSMISEKSRLNTEFEMLSWLGKGAFGDVCKVRNKLDNREYAIKRIPLTSRSRQLFKKMTREVELLSRLNHENVVRYYNSWIEIANSNDLTNRGDNLASADWSVTHESVKQPVALIMATEETCSSDWMGISPDVADDSSSDGIEFVNSQGEIIESEDTELDSSEPSRSTNETPRNFKSPRPEMQIMCIQMEFCDKSTLRTAIDSDLHQNDDRLWRLFREIAEGLSHIHQQGIIHRDLKPVNIFLDARDQVKIGDFGLATTNFLALQNQEHNVTQNQPVDIGCSLTGKVGTALYVAPELTGNASRSTYNQKVDLYSLGIILFEMCSPPFETTMERVKTIAALRLPSIIIPDYLNISKNHQRVEIIKWLLSHDQMKRPNAEELLSSDLVPPAQLEANELQEMLRHVLANPQSKAYKHLVARCLAQQSDTVEELTYHLGLVPISPTLELVKSKIISLFRKHGAVEVVTPLLSPYVNSSHSNNNAVRLMTHSGSVIILPHDLRVPFAKHVALNGINMIRRYSVGRVYREKKVFNFHPKQLYECAFDIITPNPGNLLIDAELISIAYEITNEIPALKQKNITFRMNHTSLLRAILLYCAVPPDHYHTLFASVLDHIDGKLSKFQLLSSATAIMQSSKFSATLLLDLLLTDFPLGGPRGSVNGSSLRQLIRGRGEAAALAKGAIRDLESVVSLTQGMGVNCPIYVSAGLPIGYERAKTGGIVWQMLGDLKRGKNEVPNVLAVGGRYDSMLADIRKQAQINGSILVNKDIKISGAGCSFALDKIISALHTIQRDEYRSIDVVICATGSRPPLKDVTQILRSLWTAGIRSGVVETNEPDEAQDLAKELGAVHVILFGEDGALRVRSWAQDRFQERQLNRQQLTEYIKKWLRTDSGTVSSDQTTTIANSNSNSNQPGNVSINTNFLSGPVLPAVEVVILTPDKQTANMRRRYENQLKQHMATSLVLFGRKETISVIVVDLPFSILKALTGAIDPRDMSAKSSRDDINLVVERFPKYKRYIYEIVDEIKDILADKRKPIILGLYSISDFSYRILL